MSSGMFHIYNYFKHSQTTEIPSSLIKEKVKQADELVEKVKKLLSPNAMENMLPTLVQRVPELGNMLQKMAAQEQLDFFTALEKEYSRSYSKASEG